VPDIELLCRECGFRFAGLAGRLGAEMCPRCGGTDIQALHATDRQSAPLTQQASPSDDEY
jgi:rubredoxin